LLVYFLGCALKKTRRHCSGKRAKMTTTLRYLHVSLAFALIASSSAFVQILRGAPRQPGAIPIVTDQTKISLSNQFFTPQIGGLKENGDVFISDAMALFHWDHTSSTLTRLLQLNGPIPNYSGSSAYSIANSLQLNASGHAAMINGWSAKDARDPEGVFVYNGSTYSKIALTGEAVPGLSGSAFSHFVFASINQSDQVGPS
jgi:hypothetical protein